MSRFNEDEKKFLLAMIRATEFDLETAFQRHWEGNDFHGVEPKKMRQFLKNLRTEINTRATEISANEPLV